MRFRKLSPLAAAMLLLAAAACSDHEPPTGAAAGDGASRAASQGGGRGRPERLSERLARQVPEFGGAFMEDGRLSVYLTHPGAEPAARGAVQRELARLRRSGVEVRVRPARFRFADLDRWLHAARPALPTRDLVFTEIDERTNRIRVAVADESARPRAEQALASAGAPAEAAVVVVERRAEGYASLLDRTRPYRAGTEIEGNWGTGKSVCTYGWNVLYNGVPYMIVNSHCTKNFGGPYVETEVYQDHVVSSLLKPLYYVGKEYQDPNFRTDLYGCYAALGCRFADAALVRITNNNYAYDLGGVARTVGPTSLPSYYGSLTIDDNNPRFGMAGTLSDLFVGDVVNKVGRTTGWTTGTVVATCRDVYYGDRGYLCSGSVNGPAGRGDSGSPVFWTNSLGQHLVVGILFSGAANYDGTVGDNYNFSNWSWVDYELGTILNDLQVYPYTYTPPPGGDPDPVDPPADCTTDPSLPC